MVEVNQSKADLEPVIQDSNGSWIVTNLRRIWNQSGNDYVNLAPSRFSDINATEAWFVANALVPVAYLPLITITPNQAITICPIQAPVRTVITLAVYWMFLI